jgi:hypothetical protein
MSLGSFLKKIGAWFDKTFSDIQTDIAPIAVTVTEGLKTALDSGILPSIVDLIPNVGPAIATWLKANGDAIIEKALATELGVEGLPANATTEQVTAFVQSVIAALAGSTVAAKSKIWTTVAGQLYTIIDQALNESANGALTWAQIVALIEQSYQDYLADQATAS